MAQELSHALQRLTVLACKHSSRIFDYEENEIVCGSCGVVLEKIPGPDSDEGGRI